MSLQSIEYAISEQLQSDADVMVLTAGRIYFGLRPQEDIDPAVNFYRIGGHTYMTLAGRSRLARAHMQVSSWGRTSTEASELRMFCKRILTEAPYIHGIVQSCEPVDEVDIFDATTREYQAILELEMIYAEPL